MTNYVSIEEQLNEEAKRILVLIKKDYYNVMSEEKKKILDNLLNGQVVIVSRGTCSWRKSFRRWKGAFLSRCKKF